MIPATYPTLLNASNQTQLVCYLLSSVTELTKWIDYIPVKVTGTVANSYNNNGFIAISALGSITGKTSWLDYVPMYVDASATDAWQSSSSGFIPVNYLP